MARTEYTLTLETSELIAPKIRHLTFNCESTTSFPFIPGQFITLHIPHEDKILNRSYSLANRDNSTNRLEFAASYIEKGTASELLFGLKPGGTVKATGPFGRLILREETPARYVLVATGTGITPYRAMLNEIEKRLQTQPDLQIILLFGVRKPQELLYKNEFVTFSEKNSRFIFKAYYSREMPENPAFFEHSGHVQLAFDELNLNPIQDIIYLCGNPNMIDEAFAWLTQKGFGTARIRREKYISS